MEFLTATISRLPSITTITEFNQVQGLYKGIFVELCNECTGAVAIRHSHPEFLRFRSLDRSDFIQKHEQSSLDALDGAFDNSHMDTDEIEHSIVRGVTQGERSLHLDLSRLTYY